MHLFYVKLYDSKYFWGRNNGSDDQDEFVIDEENEDYDDGNIFSIDNHLHHSNARLNAPPPSYSEVTSNPFKYPTLVIEIPDSPNTSRHIPHLDPIQEEQMTEQQTEQETRT